MAEPVDVSVIVTTYNVEAYVARAVDSALAQAAVGVEVIVVDDCSTDGTWDVIATYTDPRVQRLRLRENGGPSVARNAGIALAAGTWIAVLDGDDAFLPGRLQRCLARAAETDAHIVVDNLLVRREADGREFPMFASRSFARYKNLTLADYIAGNSSFAGGHNLGYLKPLFSRAFLIERQLAYDPALRIGEDYLLLAQALASDASCAVEPQPGYAYTVRQGSISHRLKLADIEGMLATDARFLGSYRLDRAATAAQGRRTARLKEMHAFTRLVMALKDRQLAAAARIIRHRPAAARLLWRPLWARARRLAAYPLQGERATEP